MLEAISKPSRVTPTTVFVLGSLCRAIQEPEDGNVGSIEGGQGWGSAGENRCNHDVPVECSEYSSWCCYDGTPELSPNSYIVVEGTPTRKDNLIVGRALYPDLRDLQIANFRACLLPCPAICPEKNNNCEILKE